MAKTTADTLGTSVPPDDPDAPTHAATGLGAWRLAQLERDLTLTPEARVRAAEETLRLTELVAPPGAPEVLTFDSYDAFLDHKQRRNVRR